MVAGIRYRFRVIVNLVVGLGVGHDGGAGIQGGGGGDDHTGDTGVDGFEGVWSFGIIPSEMVPSATIGAKSELVMVGITLDGSLRSFITPGVDEQYVRVTS